MQAAAEVLGREGGKSVSMLMHHSRNSEQKQWDETLVLGLSGMGRLLRAHLATIASKPEFAQVWRQAGGRTLPACMCRSTSCCLAACDVSMTGQRTLAGQFPKILCHGCKRAVNYHNASKNVTPPVSEGFLAPTPQQWRSISVQGHLATADAALSSRLQRTLVSTGYRLQWHPGVQS